MKKGKVLVTGGAGFIGSHVNLLLNERGYETVVLDNCSRGNPRSVIKGTLVQGDIGDSLLLEKLFTETPFISVMHFAAFTDVGESTRDPHLYYFNNVFNTLTLLNAVVKYKIPSFVFSSSAAVYGSPPTEIVKEGDPLYPINPYGRTKKMVEEILEDFSTSYGLKSIALRYFNAAGGDPERRIAHRKPQENNLIPLLLNSLKNHVPFTIFGTDYPTRDGTCIRDYIHVMDLAEAHLLAMERLLTGGETTAYNLGNGLGFTVREVINTVEKETGMGVNAVEGFRRPGDPAVLMADATKARIELSWNPRYPELSTIVKDAWQAFNPN